MEDDIKSIAGRLAQAVADLHAEVDASNDDVMKRHTSRMRADAEKLMNMINEAPEGSLQAHSPEERRQAAEKMKAEDMRKQADDAAANAKAQDAKASQAQKSADKK